MNTRLVLKAILIAAAAIWMSGTIFALSVATQGPHTCRAPWRMAAFTWPLYRFDAPMNVILWTQRQAFKFCGGDRP